ncbi:SGNH/GDSL hydrolase family protein [Nocardia macrotermitis]|uniref:SGNH/GDSL hydrolase family protein n=1 Tax=Nocardia macrotermitis TaxID=2585198 RepID=UPI0029E7CD67|nr:SGNH/GDSL hydrolase family protein [Nocardia macrotermitis]
MSGILHHSRPGTDPESTRWHGKKYVALGSSFASGPAIAPREPDAPRLAGRSRNNYAHLVAAAAQLELTDVTSSGATCEHILHEQQYGQPPQIRAVDSATDLVTLTIGGNDVGLTQYRIAHRLPLPLRLIPPIARLGDETAVNHRLHTIEQSLTEVLTTIARRAPRARVLVVNYLSLLGPVSAQDRPVDRNYQQFAESLAAHTASAAARADAELIDARTPSLDHPPGSTGAWTIGGYLPLPGRQYPGAPFHPTAAGMAGVADLILDRLASLPPIEPQPTAES